MFSAEELNDFYNHKHEHKEEGSGVDHGLLNKHVYNMRFVGANSNNDIIASQKNKYYRNYYLGNDPSKWAANVKSYQKINYQNLYDGIVYISVFAFTVMIIGGARLCQLSFQFGQTSATLEIPLGFIYLVVPIAGILICYYSLDTLLNKRKLNKA